MLLLNKILFKVKKKCVYFFFYILHIYCNDLSYFEIHYLE